MKDVAIERARKHHKCPYCNNEASESILRGFK